MLVLVTGAHGFVGREVVKHFATLGHVVVGLGHGAWAELEYRQIGLSNWISGSITIANLDSLALHYGCPDVVIHLAGGSSVGVSFLAPVEDLTRTVMGGAELLEWVRLRSPGTRIVLASSAAVYGACHDAPVREDALCHPFSPYGFHKRMIELLFESYARNFDLRVGVVRLFSVYGSELRKQLLWDACCRLASNVDLLQLGGTGDETRDWLHVSDAARLIALVVEQVSSTYFVVNGGTGVATPVCDIANQLCASWGSKVRPNFSGYARAGDPVHLVADTAYLISLGFIAEKDWCEGISEYVAWFKTVNGVKTP